MALSAHSEITRFKFRPEDDQTLRDLVDQFGTNSWVEIARVMPGRNVRQCRDRWNHYLSRNASVPWTSEEDALLVRMVETYGRKWARLATFFPNRTDFSLKARWSQIYPRVARSPSPPHFRCRERSQPTEDRVPFPSLSVEASAPESSVFIVASLCGSRLPFSLRDPAHNAEFPRCTVEPLYDPCAWHGMANTSTV
jgi:hypothetical protein